MMETKTKVGVTALLAIVSTLTILGVISLTDDNVYYCEARSLVMECNRLSSTNKTCYNSEEGNKRCYEGWIEVIDDREIPELSIDYHYLCNLNGCTKMGDL